MQKQIHALVKKEYRVPFVLVTSLFFLWGFAHAILDVLNKHFQDVLVITRTHSAWVQVMFGLLRDGNSCGTVYQQVRISSGSRFRAIALRGRFVTFYSGRILHVVQFLSFLIVCHCLRIGIS